MRSPHSEEFGVKRIEFEKRTNLSKEKGKCDEIRSEGSGG